jgi:hypothetical protein
LPVIAIFTGISPEEILDKIASQKRRCQGFFVTGGYEW